MRACLFIAAGAAGCGGSNTTVSGEVGGETLKPMTAFWGGPFIIVSNKEFACIDIGWVGRYYDEENPPGDENQVLLQFTYVGDEVTTGRLDVQGESAVKADFFVLQDGAVENSRARTGLLDINEAEKGKNALGTFDLEFDDGSLSGELDVEWCTNLKG